MNIIIVLLSYINIYLININIDINILIYTCIIINIYYICNIIKSISLNHQNEKE